MTKNALVRRLKTLTAVRVLFVTVLLGTFLLFEIGYRALPYPKQVFHLIVFLYGLTIAYAVLLARGHGTKTLAYSQLSADVLSAVTLIFLTGGIESWFSSVLLLIVIAAATVLGSKAGYVTATLSSIFYGSLIDLQYYGILKIPYDPMLLERDFLYNIFSHIVGLYLTAYLTGHLSSRLEKMALRLERKTTDLRDLTVFNREVIENMPSGLFTTDLTGRVLLFNKAAEDILGIGRGEAIGEPAGSVMPFAAGLEERKDVEVSLGEGGDARIIGLTISRMKDAKGEATGFIGMIDDLTAFKGMQEEVKRKERLADIGELAANIAHEIRNPLASLKGSVEMLKEGSVTPEQKSRLMDIAIGEMNRLNSIITDFLSYSRPKPLEREAFDLNRVLSGTVEMLGNMNAAGITVKGEFSGSLVINADPQRLQQVFWNLGINAIEAMPEGGELIVRSLNGGRAVEVVFEDTGIGIAPENLTKVFYPFFTTKDSGTGLGLSIAYRIIEDHQGGMGVSARPGGGTVFRIYLPKGLE